MSHIFRFAGLHNVWAALLLSAAGLLASCVTQDVEDDTRSGNFEALWSVLDQHYCFFREKADEYGLDWYEVRERYKPQISESMTNRQLFEVLSNMTYDSPADILGRPSNGKFRRFFVASAVFPFSFGCCLALPDGTDEARASIWMLGQL